MSDLATLQSQLYQLEQAKIDLLSGKKVQSASAQGKSASFMAFSLKDLNEAIAAKRREIALLEGKTPQSRWINVGLR